MQSIRDTSLLIWHDFGKRHANDILDDAPSNCREEEKKTDMR